MGNNQTWISLPKNHFLNTVFRTTRIQISYGFHKFYHHLSGVFNVLYTVQRSKVQTTSLSTHASQFLFKVNSFDHIFHKPNNFHFIIWKKIITQDLVLNSKTTHYSLYLFPVHIVCMEMFGVIACVLYPSSETKEDTNIVQ